ncbi:MAG: M15 family metallopeptidase [Bacteroidota bacterium]
MRIFPVYFLALTLAISSCNVDLAKDREVISQRKIFVLYDTLERLQESKQIIPNVDTSYLEYVFKAYNLESIRSLDSSIQVNLMYAGTSNFMGVNFYDGLRQAYFPCEVALGLCRAQYYLKLVNPGFSLLVLDAARPLHIQQMMWDSLKMPDDRKFNYLSPPYETSLHNYGCAADVTIVELSTGLQVDMGSDFDTFEKISQPAFEQKFLGNGELSREAYENRRLLRWAMKRGGFASIASEWWHFGYGNKTLAATKFKLIK